MVAPRLRLGQLLVDARLITPETLAETLEQQKTDGRRLGQLLVERGLIDETQLTQILSHQLSVPWVSLLHIEFTRQLLNLVPRETAEKYCLVPIYVRHVRRQGDTLYAAMEDPSNEEALRECEAFSGLPTRPMIAPPSDIRNAIRVYYRASKVPEPVPGALGEAEATAPAAADAAAPTANPPEAELVAAPRVPTSDAPVIEAVELELTRKAEERVREIEQRDTPDEIQVPQIPRPKGRAPRMIAVTLLDGTTITLPARARRGAAGADLEEVRLEPKPAPHRTGADESEEEMDLTARDLVAALRAVAHGADPNDILGGTIPWERLFAALLSLLLKKHLIADWEFVEELKKM